MNIRKPQFKKVINQLENKMFNHTKQYNNLRTNSELCFCEKDIREKRLATIDTYIKVILASF